LKNIQFCQPCLTLARFARARRVLREFCFFCSIGRCDWTKSARSFAGFPTLPS